MLFRSIKGTNDAPVISSSTQAGEVKEDTTLTATGQVTSTDVDHNATATYTGDATGTYGSFAIDSASGQWTYTLDNANHQNLALGDNHTETFTVTVTDDKGATDSKATSVTVTAPPPNQKPTASFTSSRRHPAASAWRP